MNRSFQKELPVLLTETEINERARQIATQERHLAQVELDLKEIKSRYKNLIDNSLALIRRLADTIESGAEQRLVTCEIRLNLPYKGKKVIVRTDTGDVVEVLDMSPDDMQTDLALEGANIDS
jgi:hypothetical protein